jgi:hypothetical protein
VVWNAWLNLKCSELAAARVNRHCPRMVSSVLNLSSNKVIIDDHCEGMVSSAPSELASNHAPRNHIKSIVRGEEVTK